MARATLADDGTLIWECPGCGENHGVPIRGGRKWEWNGSIELPTLTPSVLLRSGHYNPGRPSEECWCTYNKKYPDNPSPFQCRICHSFIREGKIEFLHDCSHNLAGKTVDIPEWGA